jgi:hypothetical protein
MKDEKLQAVLKRASEDEVFRYRLLNDREATVNELDLSDAEKNMLKSISEKQLEKMIEKYGWWKRQMKFSHSSGDYTTILTGVAILALLSGMTLGATGHVPEEIRAQRGLMAIRNAQEFYMGEYGHYTDMRTLVDDAKTKELMQYVNKETKYVFEIETASDGKNYTAIARHRERPDTRKGFSLSADGSINELPKGDGASPRK